MDEDCTCTLPMRMLNPAAAAAAAAAGAPRGAFEGNGKLQGGGGGVEQKV